MTKNICLRLRHYADDSLSDVQVIELDDSLGKKRVLMHAFVYRMPAGRFYALLDTPFESSVAEPTRIEFTSLSELSQRLYMMALLGIGCEDNEFEDETAEEAFGACYTHLSKHDLKCYGKPQGEGHE